MNEIFLTRLIQLRKQERKTQEEMAQIINVKRATYGAYEKGRILPPYDKISALANYFNVSIDYLMGNTNSKKHDDVNTHDIPDVNELINVLLNDLKDKSTELKIDGYQLDDESRELLVASVENSLKMGKIISERKRKDEK